MIKVKITEADLASPSTLTTPRARKYWGLFRAINRALPTLKMNGLCWIHGKKSLCFGHLIIEVEDNLDNWLESEDVYPFSFELPPIIESSSSWMEQCIVCGSWLPRIEMDDDGVCWECLDNEREDEA